MAQKLQVRRVRDRRAELRVFLRLPEGEAADAGERGDMQEPGDWIFQVHLHELVHHRSGGRDIQEAEKVRCRGAGERDGSRRNEEARCEQQGQGDICKSQVIGVEKQRSGCGRAYGRQKRRGKHRAEQGIGGARARSQKAAANLSAYIEVLNDSSKK